MKKTLFSRQIPTEGDPPAVLAPLHPYTLTPLHPYTPVFLKSG